MEETYTKFQYPYKTSGYLPGSNQFKKLYTVVEDKPLGTWGKISSDLSRHDKTVFSSGTLNQLGQGTRYNNKVQAMRLVVNPINKFTPIGGSIPRVVGSENEESMPWSLSNPVTGQIIDSQAPDQTPVQTPVANANVGDIGDGMAPVMPQNPPLMPTGLHTSSPNNTGLNTPSPSSSNIPTSSSSGLSTLPTSSSSGTSSDGSYLSARQGIYPILSPDGSEVRERSLSRIAKIFRDALAATEPGSSTSGSSSAGSSRPNQADGVAQTSPNQADGVAQTSPYPDIEQIVQDHMEDEWQHNDMMQNEYVNRIRNLQGQVEQLRRNIPQPHGINNLNPDHNIAIMELAQQYTEVGRRNVELDGLNQELMANVQRMQVLMRENYEINGQNEADIAELRNNMGEATQRLMFINTSHDRYRLASRNLLVRLNDAARGEALEAGELERLNIDYRQAEDRLLMAIRGELQIMDAELPPQYRSGTNSGTTTTIGNTSSSGRTPGSFSVPSARSSTLTALGTPAYTSSSGRTPSSRSSTLTALGTPAYTSSSGRTPGSFSEPSARSSEQSEYLPSQAVRAGIVRRRSTTSSQESRNRRRVRVRNQPDRFQ